MSLALLAPCNQFRRLLDRLAQRRVGPCPAVAVAAAAAAAAAAGGAGGAARSWTRAAPPPAASSWARLLAPEPRPLDNKSEGTRRIVRDMAGPRSGMNMFGSDNGR
ncbi:hypothetical protein ACJJTC_004682 [Scirpophaga incertulas]